MQVFYATLAFFATYLIFRPRLAASLGLAAVDALLSYGWASGADILAELDLWIYEKFTGHGRWRFWRRSPRRAVGHHVEVGEEAVRMMTADVASQSSANFSGSFDALLHAASLGAKLATSLQDDSLDPSLSTGLAAEAVAQTGTAGYGICSMVGFVCSAAKIGKRLGF